MRTIVTAAKRPRAMPALLCNCVLILLLGVSSTGCAKLGYYTQAINGQLQILTKRKPIPALLNDPATKPELKTQLALILEMRRFASDRLALPDNKSYRTYVDLERPYVAWNVFAAPEFSLTPVDWCFAFVGCLSYRGYFSKEGAEKFARKLNDQGYDVYVAGIAAYSTLGWFHDPVLNTILNRSRTEIAGLIFHELAHQLIYVKNDTAFNESFAATVELEGIRRWLEYEGSIEQFQKYVVKKKRREDFVKLVMESRRRLEQLYASPTSDEEKRAAKIKAFVNLRLDYKKLKRSWGGYTGFDAWFAKDLNNAKLVSMGLYNKFVPAFQTLLQKNNRDLRAFYDAVEQLGRLTKEERVARLRSLQAELDSCR